LDSFTQSDVLRLLRVFQRVPEVVLKTAHEFKIMRIRECVAGEMLDTPEKAAAYWRANIPQAEWFDAAKEAVVVLILNTRRRIIGHNLVTLGSLDTCLIHAREVFRPAIVAAGSAIIIMHNLCTAVHKLCYVERPFMCSHRLAGLASPRVPQREEWL
jgi:hypothetical protein